MRVVSRIKSNIVFLKFVFVGMLNTLVGTAIMFGMYNILGFGYYFSSFCNYFFGSILSYFLNKYFTFNYKKKSPVIVFKFILNIIICYVIAYGVAKPLMRLLFANENVKFVENLAMLFGMVVFVGINYFGQKLFVFRNSANTKTKEDFNQLNYVDMLRIRNILNLKNLKSDFSKCIANEINNEEKNIKNSLWNGTNSLICYVNILKKIQKKKIKMFYIRKLLKKISIQKKKIKMLFIVCEFQTFPSVMPFYDECKKDEHFEVNLVHVPFIHLDKVVNIEEEIMEYKKNGYDAIRYENYDLYNESPDIAVFVKPYDSIPKKFYIDEIEKVIKKSIYIPYCMESGGAKEFLRYQFQLPMHEKVWKVLSYSPKHYQDAKIYSNNKGKNYFPIGHPRMDFINYDFSNNAQYKKIKKLAKGRKIIMWNCHFTIQDGDNLGTFLQFGDTILNIAKNDKSFFLLFRPHPFFMNALNDFYKDKPEKLAEFHKIIEENKDNIYFDSTGNYLISIAVSDALISDASSIVEEYLAYNKPILYTKKKNTTGFINKEIETILSVVNNEEDIYEFIEDIKNDKDVLKEVRSKMINSIIYFSPKKSVSKKLKEYILNNLEKELKKDILKNL